MYFAKIVLATVSLCAAVLPIRAGAVQEWRILALRVDFPLEDPDELSTTGTGRFDLRAHEEALPDYLLPFDTPPHDRHYFENHLQALARYYRTVSEGNVEIDFAVYPQDGRQAYTLPRAMLQYGNGRTEEEIGGKWIELFRDAVDLAGADADGPRFADFNSFLIFHAGVGHETGELNDIRSVYLAPGDFIRYAEEPVLADGGTFEIQEGWILPETPSPKGQAGLNGLLAKFFGHQLGLPGLSNFADGLPAVGGWSLMDVGANRLGFALRTRPGLADTLLPVIGFAAPHPMAWSKARLGWIEPLVVVRDTTVELLATDRAGDVPKAVRVPLDGDEYLLLENRQTRGHRGVPDGVESPFRNPEDDDEVVWIGEDEIEFSRDDRTGSWLGVAECDVFVPGSGVLIWHVDEKVIREKSGEGAINNDPVHPGIALKEADGHRDIGNPVFERLDEIEGSVNDPFFVGGQTRLGPDTWPDVRTYRGWNSGVEIEVLSEPGDVMRVRVRFARLAAGWPQMLQGGRRLQAADVDGDGADELIAEGDAGIRVARFDGSEVLMIDGGRFLAAGDGDGDGRAAVFALRNGGVEAWEAGSGDPVWTVALGFEPVAALFSDNLELFPGRPVLALAGVEVILLDAENGALLRRESVAGVSVAVGDLDGDGDEELIAADGKGLWLVEESGSRQLWETPEGGLLPPVAGDLDGDGRAEVVCADARGKVWLYEEGGARLAAEVGDSLRAGPVIGDLDGVGDLDGRAFLEVVIGGAGQVYALQANGLGMSDFPARLPDFADSGAMARPPVLLDLDWDGKHEIFFGTRRGLFGIDGNGSLLPGFPLLTAGSVAGVPVGADLDGDGRVELAALGGEWLYVWEPQNFTPEYVGQRVGWGQEGYDAAGARAYRGMGEALEPVGEAEILPAKRAYCYPNPVSGDEQAHLRFFLNQPARVELEVFDAIGTRIESRRVEGLMGPAENEIVWSVDEYASGLYICRLEARDDGGDEEVVFVKMAVSR